MEHQEVHNRLQHFPITLFAVVMGLSGLAIVFQKASEILHFPHFIGTVIAFIDLLLFLVIVIFYVSKLFSYPTEVRKEFSHPIRINFFAAISISLLLLAVIFSTISPTISSIFFYVGVSIHTFFTFYIIAFWINHNFELNHSNPAWFIPIVGNVIVPVAGAGIVPSDFLTFYFAIGMFFWVVLFTLILNRIIFHNQLPQKFIPTIFILIAPPAVGFIAYIKLGFEYDLIARMLYDLALFFTILVFFMYKSFLKLKFFISWWAFTFPLAAITIATLLSYKITGYMFYEFLSYFLILFTTFVVGLVALRTIQHMFKKEVCVPE
ncbi:MAG: SLAC1 anion channel family protein [Campylobacterales bacterium]